MSTEYFSIRAGGEYFGDLSLRQIMRMRQAGGLVDPVEYFNPAMSEWRPLRGIVCDRYPCRLPEMKEAGILKVRLLTSNEEGDCPVCIELSRRVIRIEEAKSLPIPGCTCEPHCRSNWIAVVPDIPDDEEG